ncbi:putative RNAse III [Talaromyces proteolyticus]|uniref:RNAse III n=1 Tax=Talaromyces proteolyticus TaxID=1131652 RepID=A0AAD4KKQ4_9EURO|nr:putative RNAse III [Talaromyces proteolyticus]KAH8693223.1 putative RNAse III [Talaromyces proteolyticus]
MASVFTPGDRARYLERMISYEFNDKTLVNHALTSAGYALPVDGNKDLAMVGDAVLKVVLVTDGYTRGQINDVVSTKGSKVSLAEAGFRNGLDGFIYVNPAQGGHVSDGVMATAVEAIFGAVYIDSGRDITPVERAIAAFQLAWSSEPFS